MSDKLSDTETKHKEDDGWDDFDLNYDESSITNNINTVEIHVGNVIYVAFY